MLECEAVNVAIAGCAMHEMHVSLPETTEFKPTSVVTPVTT